MAGKLVAVLAVLGGVALAVLGILELPPISWLNDLQMRWFGWYSFRITCVVCVLIALVPLGLISSLLRRMEESSNVEQKAAIARRLGQKPFQGRIEGHE